MLNTKSKLGGSSSTSGGKPNTPDFYHYYYSQPLNGPSRASQTQTQTQAAAPQARPTTTIDFKAIATEVLNYMKYIVKQKLFYKVVAWLLVFWFFVKIEFGAVFVVLSGFGLIFTHLGERKKGEVSAYNVFNKNHKELPGTLNARQFENELMMRNLND